jgi:integrase
MIKTLFRPKRFCKGKRVTSRLYSLKLRLNGELNITTIPLGVSDRQVAEEKARKLVQEREKESQGLIAPKLQRDSAQASLQKHIQEFARELRTKGANNQYINELENKLELLTLECHWQQIKDITADSFMQWRSRQNKAPKTINEYLAAAKSLLNWMVRFGRLVGNPLVTVQKVEERGREVRNRRAYTDDEMKALLAVSGQRAMIYTMAALTGLRHGELKRLRWGDLNLSAEKPSVLVRASISKNHKQTCLPLHPALFKALVRYRSATIDPGDLVFGRLVPRSDVFIKDLMAAAIVKKNSEGRVVDFHSFRHTFCTYLHLAGVPMREAMELMRHSDVRLTMKTYADTSMFALRPAVEKLPWNYPSDHSQLHSQRIVPAGLLQSLAGTVDTQSKPEGSPMNMGFSSLSVIACHGVAKKEEWCAIQGSNL